MRSFREARQLTQEALAEQADLHTTYISSVERGERNLSLYNITRIAYALQLPPSGLMQCVDPQPTSKH